MKRTPEAELMDDRAEAEAYARADFASVNEAFVAALFSRMELGDVGALVDLGTGPGDILIRIVRAGWQGRVVAVDGAPAMIEIARQTAENVGLVDHIEFSTLDALDTGLPGESFRVVVSNSLLHHVRDPLMLWREAWRLVKPGGLIFVRDLRRPASVDEARSIVQRYAGRESALLREEFERSLLAAYTVDEVRGQLAKLNMSGEVIESSDRHLDVVIRRR